MRAMLNASGWGPNPCTHCACSPGLSMRAGNMMLSWQMSQASRRQRPCGAAGTLTCGQRSCRHAQVKWLESQAMCWSLRREESRKMNLNGPAGLPESSLIIASRNRPELLHDTVQSILRGDETPTEIIII